jgi:hypothetical protein
MHRKLFATVSGLFLVLSACPCPAATPPEFAAVRKSLEHAAIEYRVFDEERGFLSVKYEMTRHRDFEGDQAIELILGIRRIDQRPWLEISAFNLFSGINNGHPSAARRVLLGAADKVEGSLATFSYDESDGTVTGHVRIPIPTEGVDAEMMKTVVENLPNTVDAIEPVYRRAVHTGLVDWPQDDQGPKRPTNDFEAKGKRGEAIRVQWALWSERRVWASTLIAADALLRKFSTLNDERRDELGMQIARESVGPSGAVARACFTNWLRGAQYMEQHYPPVAVRVWAPTGTVVKATVRCPQYARAAEAAEMTVDEMGYVDVEPLLKWNEEALAKIEKPTIATFEVDIEAGSVLRSDKAEVEIQPLSEAELGLPLGAPVAAYVSESHPWVKDLIAEAGRLRIATDLGFLADQTTYSDAVRQLYAVWRAFRNRDLKYVSIVAANGAQNAAQTSQTIRQFHEAISDQGANCADGSAALASVLQALDFDVHLFLVPGHVFVGVYLPSEDGKDPWICIETTRLGDDAVSPDQHFFDKVEATVPSAFRDGDWDCFEAACERANAEYLDAMQKGDLLIAQLQALRKAGLKPIPASRSALGKLPPAPDTRAINARRAAAQSAERAKYEAELAWARSLPNGTPTPYRDADALMRDVESVGQEPAAIGRLLRSVSGSGEGPCCLRALSVLYDDALSSFHRAVLDRFGQPLLAGAILELPAANAQAAVRRLGNGLSAVELQDADGDTIARLPLVFRESGVLIAGDELCLEQPSVGRDAKGVVRVLRDDALRDPTGLKRIGSQVASMVEAGRFNDFDQAAKAVWKLIVEQYGREAAGGAAGEGVAAAEPEVAGALAPLDLGAARAGDSMQLHYQVLLADGKVVFDTRQRGKPSKLTAGRAKPSGLGNALVGMHAGEKRTITVPPSQGWGSQGSPSFGIPPNSTVTFVIEVISINMPAP